MNVSISNVQGLITIAFPISELYFLIAKFLSGGPLKETAKVNSLPIILNYTLLRFFRLKWVFLSTDTAERARDDRGKLELFLAPGSELRFVLIVNARG